MAEDARAQRCGQWLGEIMLSSERQWRTELRGMSRVLAQRMIEPYTPDCRTDLGDARLRR